MIQVKETVEYGGGEVYERAPACDLLSRPCLEGRVKHLKLTEERREPVIATALRAIR